MSIRDEFAQMARTVGELGSEDPMRDSLVEFAELVTAKCARIGDLYGDWDRNAGDHIRAVMYELPELGHEPAEKS